MLQKFEYGAVGAVYCKQIPKVRSTTSDLTHGNIVYGNERMVKDESTKYGSDTGNTTFQMPTQAYQRKCGKLRTLARRAESVR